MLHSLTIVEWKSTSAELEPVLPLELEGALQRLKGYDVGIMLRPSWC